MAENPRFDASTYEKARNQITKANNNTPTHALDEIIRGLKEKERIQKLQDINNATLSLEKSLGSSMIVTSAAPISIPAITPSSAVAAKPSATVAAAPAVAHVVAHVVAPVAAPTATETAKESNIQVSDNVRQELQKLGIGASILNSGEKITLIFRSPEPYTIKILSKGKTEQNLVSIENQGMPIPAFNNSDTRSIEMLNEQGESGRITLLINKKNGTRDIIKIDPFRKPAPAPVAVALAKPAANTPSVAPADQASAPTQVPNKTSENTELLNQSQFKIGDRVLSPLPGEGNIVLTILSVHTNKTGEVILKNPTNNTIITCPISELQKAPADKRILTQTLATNVEKLNEKESFASVPLNLANLIIALENSTKNSDTNLGDTPEAIAIKKELPKLKEALQKKEIKDLFEDKASNKVSIVNDFLKEHGFSIGLTDQGTEGYYVASVFKQEFEWKDKIKGKESKIILKDSTKTVDAVLMTQNVQKFTSEGNNIYTIAGENGSTISMMPFNATITKDTMNLSDMINKIDKAKVPVTISQDGFRFPMVDFKQEGNIEWLKQAKIGGVQIKEAKHQEYLRISATGVQAGSGMTAGGTRAISLPEEINGPMLVWITKGKTITFSAKIGENDMKKPQEKKLNQP